nr:zinc finger, CCHC-type [Tanacetum cinerariifolium]
MSVGYVLTTPMPGDEGDNPTVEQVRRRVKWDNDDYFCRGLILNGMSDSLFDIYQNVKTSKELWDTLEAKYMAEDASSKKFLVLADLPSGCKRLGYKWIFKRKLKVDRTVEKFKASLIIHQIRLLIAMALIHSLIIHQMDLKIAFLNGELEEEAVSQLEYSRVIGCSIYVMTYTRSDIEFAVGKLSRYTSNPGTQHWQAIQQRIEAHVLQIIPMICLEPAEKEDEVVNFLMVNFFEKMLSVSMNKEEPPIKFDKSSKGVINCLYVDDMLIFGTDQVQVNLTKKCLSSRFSMKDIGEADVILVLEGYTNASWISNTKDNSSTSGWVFLLGGGAISWASKKQTCITGLTM